MNGIRIIGRGKYLPTKEVTSKVLAKKFNTTEEYIYKVCGIKLADFINQKNLSMLKAEKLIEETQSHLFATNEGRLVLNKLIEDLCS